MREGERESKGDKERERGMEGRKAFQLRKRGIGREGEEEEREREREGERGRERKRERGREREREEEREREKVHKREEKLVLPPTPTGSAHFVDMFLVRSFHEVFSERLSVTQTLEGGSS